jgi:hypothetical protein
MLRSPKGKRAENVEVVASSRLSKLAEGAFAVPSADRPCLEQFTHRGGIPMSEKKPQLIAERFAVRMCPVCGTRSYSRNGVHPQCAVVHADAPRKAQLAETRRQERRLTHPR